MSRDLGSLMGCRFGKYELHDLVVLDQQTTGIIIGVDKESCRVLTTEVTLPPLSTLISFFCNVELVEK